jgi:hypothetical protein
VRLESGDSAGAREDFFVAQTCLLQAGSRKFSKHNLSLTLVAMGPTRNPRCRFFGARA